ncbi:uncharacterized protein VDAG_09868 [Verticillium dahliae VdLs.17]|uniref:Uncharacterized protein n=1 Tax=Verticillium dahliae (strain VdLs.17 / ATCC MYA-4575 / FGSC 10137) TaxID=498257 RepID=G2XI86_VERDV|nr:uncharacterized protein VDAG_09868 [Verticillium dahliae VdLs.17]EGY19534.1 hypothetical protein VDAG_09868 [Verticillium dahliae VdLs.17]
MHSSALLRLVVGSSALIVGVQAQQSSELPIPSSVAPSSVAPSSVAPSSVAPSSAAPSSAAPSSAAPSSEPASSEPASSSLAASATATVTDTVTDTVYPTPTSFHSHLPPYVHLWELSAPVPPRLRDFNVKAAGPKPTLTHHYTIDKCQKYHGKDCYPGQVYTKHYEAKPWYYEECTTYVSYVHGVATTCTDTYTRTSWYDQEKTTIKQYEHKQTYYETHGAATPEPVPVNPPVNPPVTVIPHPEPGKTVTGDVPVNPPVTVIPHPEPEHTVTANKPVQPPVTVVPVPVPSPETSQVIVSGQPSLRDAGFLPLLIALGLILKALLLM